MKEKRGRRKGKHERRMEGEGEERRMFKLTERGRQILVKRTDGEKAH